MGKRAPEKLSRALLKSRVAAIVTPRGTHMGAWMPYTVSRSYPRIDYSDSDVPRVVHPYRLWVLEMA